MNTLLNRFASPGFLVGYALLLILPVIASRAAVTTDSLGWTVVTPSADSIIVYVSNAGNDSNDGLTTATPKATIAGADALVRDGYPDQILLRRGDTFTQTLTTVPQLRWKNGRNANEPIVMSYYGSSGPRPVIKITNRFIDHNGGVRNYQAFIGLDIYNSQSDPASADYTGVSCTEALRLVGGGANIIVEDCRFRFNQTTVQSFGTAIYSNFQFTRNIVTDAWVLGSYTTSTQDRKSGLYVSGVNGYTIDENFFDHNGWSETVPTAGANAFSHNLYVQSDNMAGGIFRGNIFARASSHGLQARSGGIVDRNLFVLNAIGMESGYSSPPTDPNVLTFANTVNRNVVIEGRLMDANTNYPRTSAVWGIDDPGYPSGLPVDDNIVANRRDSGQNMAFPDAGNMALTNNIVRNWEPARDMTDPTWPHPGDNLGNFYATIGGTNSETDYLTYLRNRSVHTLPWNMTAYAAINYIRAGFNKAPVTGLFHYSLAQGRSATASTSQAGYGAANGGDGSFATRWASSIGVFPQWWKVDLGISHDLKQAIISWYASSSNSYRYKIEVSSDDVTYTTAVDQSGRTVNGDSNDVFSATGRYVRITVTGSTSGSAGFWECALYGR